MFQKIPRIFVSLPELPFHQLPNEFYRRLTYKRHRGFSRFNVLIPRSSSTQRTTNAVKFTCDPPERSSKIRIKCLRVALLIILCEEDISIRWTVGLRNSRNYNQTRSTEFRNNRAAFISVDIPASMQSSKSFKRLSPFG